MQEVVVENKVEMSEKEKRKIRMERYKINEQTLMLSKCKEKISAILGTVIDI